jgi:hypothetical protein
VPLLVGDPTLVRGYDLGTLSANGMHGHGCQGAVAGIAISPGW